MHITKILVDLDCIVDSRLGTLYKGWPSKIDEILESDYYKREADDWSDLGIDKKEYDEAYNNRDIETLKNSYKTNFINKLIKKIIDLDASRITNPRVGNIHLNINFHPYKLPDAVVKKYIDIFTYIMPPTIVIKAVNMPFKDISLNLLRQEYGGYYLYSFNDWYVAQYENLKNQFAPDVAVSIPKLFPSKDSIPTKDDLEDCIVKDPFASLYLSLADRFRLEINDIGQYCVIKDT